MINKAIKPHLIERTYVLDDIVKNDLLKALSISVDSDGYLVYTDTPEKVLSMNGREMREDEFAGVIKGSTLLMRSDIDSLIDLAEKLVTQG